LQLGGQTEAMEKAENQHRRPHIGLDAEPASVGAQIVQGLVDHRQADDRIDQPGVQMPAPNSSAAPTPGSSLSFTA
jgi:hypothetical protein